MFAASKDEKCLELQKDLMSCADIHRSVEIARNKGRHSDVFFRHSVYCFDKFCSVRNEFYKNFDSYINSVKDLEYKKYLASRFVFIIMKLSKDKATLRKNHFFDEGLNLISHIVKNYPLTEQGREGTLSYIKKNRVSNNVNKQVMERLAPKNYKNPLEGKYITDVEPSLQLIKEYTNYICCCAYDYNTTNISANVVFNLLEINTSKNKLDIIQPTIFEEAKKIKAINKTAVLEVVKAYAGNIDEYSENNSQFDNNMKKMFSYIVTNYGYTSKDVEQLKQTLVDNSADKKFAEKMAQNISAEYISSKQNTKDIGR